MVYCCYLSFFFVSSSRMSATTCWDHCLHWKYLYDRSYYLCISLFHSRPLSDWLCGVTFSSNFIPAQWRHITVTMVYFFSFFFVSSSRMSATTHWDHWLHWMYFAERSYYCCISLFFTWPLSDRLRGVMHGCCTRPTTTPNINPPPIHQHQLITITSTYSPII